MEMLTKARNEYLLQANLEVLHEQSLEWLNELRFQKEEIVFLNKLLNRNFQQQFPSAECASMDKELTIFNSECISALLTKVEDHERRLSHIVQTDASQGQYLYRENHRDLTHDFTVCRETFFAIKKRIFAFVKNIA